MSDPDYDPRRFRGNVPFYARYRLSYPDSLIERIVALAGLRRADAVMDLGAGPGLLAIPLARAGMRVTAVDPEPDMLTTLGEAAAKAGVELDARLGSSFEMPPGVGPFRLVAIGRAFHWMDRATTLDMLDRIVLREGAIALVHDNHPAAAENAWRNLLREIAHKYGRAEVRDVMAGRALEYRTHESLLRDSAFSRIERVGIVIRRAVNADEIVGLGYSLSALSPEKLGGRAGEFERELRGELARLSPDGRFTEIAELSALIAKRP